MAGSAEELKEKKAHFLKKRVEAKEKKAREEEEVSGQLQPSQHRAYPM